MSSIGTGVSIAVVFWFYRIKLYIGLCFDIFLMEKM